METRRKTLLISLFLFAVFVSINVKAQDEYLTFDGTDDYVALPISYNGVNAIPEVSVEAWVRTSFTGSGYNSNWAIVDFDRSDFYDLFVRGDNGRVGFSTYSATGGINDFYGNIAVNDGQWHHIAAVYDGVDKHIYVDGILDTSIANPHGGNALGKATTRFGFIGDGSEASSYNAGKNNIFYDGDISEVRIWSRALDATELDANKFPGTLSGNEAGLYAYYTFGSGAVNDLGPNGFDGGIFNGPIFNNSDGVPPPPTSGSSVWSTNGNTAYYTSGNVAIGRTTVPNGYALAVDGFIRAREMRVDQDTWPDFVFEKDYKLPSLQEIERHIEKKGHLPKIPSAEEVDAHGIELGNMNRLLLEKIEELTLHIIAQEKRIAKLEGENN
ncbi:LamG domain-containing protein [uncultured Croceitalea sp.]